MCRHIVFKRDENLETLRPLGKDDFKDEKQQALKQQISAIVEHGEGLVRDIKPQVRSTYIFDFIHVVLFSDIYCLFLKL